MVQGEGGVGGERPQPGDNLMGTVCFLARLVQGLIAGSINVTKIGLAGERFTTMSISVYKTNQRNNRRYPIKAMLTQVTHSLLQQGFEVASYGLLCLLFGPKEEEMEEVIPFGVFVRKGLDNDKARRPRAGNSRDLDEARCQ